MKKDVNAAYIKIKQNLKKICADTDVPSKMDEFRENPEQFIINNVKRIDKQLDSSNSIRIKEKGKSREGEKG